MNKNNNNDNNESIKCYYCPKQFDREQDYLKHAKDKHPEELLQPNIGMIQIIQKKWDYDISPLGNPWE